jgi:hypothetical protein
MDVKKEEADRKAHLRHTRSVPFSILLSCAPISKISQRKASVLAVTHLIHQIEHCRMDAICKLNKTLDHVNPTSYLGSSKRALPLVLTFLRLSHPRCKVRTVTRKSNSTFDAPVRISSCPSTTVHFSTPAQTSNQRSEDILRLGSGMRSCCYRAPLVTFLVSRMNR